MKEILAVTLFCGFAIALYLFFNVLCSGHKKNLTDRLFAAACFASAVWCLGFGGLILQTNMERAHIWRSVGMLGVFAYLIAVQLLVFQMAEIRRKIQPSTRLHRSRIRQLGHTFYSLMIDSYYVLSKKSYRFILLFLSKICNSSHLKKKET